MLLGLLLAVLQGAAARYYTPTLQCEGGPTILNEEETLQVNGIEANTVFASLDQVHLNTVLVVQPVPGDLIDLAASFPSFQQDYHVTEVELVQETLPVTQTQIDTVTTNIVKTEVDVSTLPATNYVTVFETLGAPTTSRVTVTNSGTLFSQLTVTSHSTVFTTLTVTAAEVVTDVVTESVPQTTYVATATETYTENSTNVHSLTKMITQFVCPPGLDYD